MRHLDNGHRMGQAVWRQPVAALRWYLAALAGDEAVGAEPRVPLDRIAPDRRWTAFLERYWRSLRWRLAAGLMLALVLGGTTGLLLGRHALWEHVLAATGPGFAASPFFTLEGFHALRPGMTADEVRDRIGYPLDRVAAESGPRWVYTQPAGPADTWFKLCIAVFDRPSGRLAKAKELAASCPTGPVTPLRYPWTETLLCDVGELHLLGMDGAEQVLKPDGKAFFLEVHTPPGTPEAESASLGMVGESSPATIRLYSLEGAASGGGEEGFRGTFAETRPTLPKNMRSSPCVYKNGKVYALPPWNNSDAAEMRDDRDWLVRRLTGRSVALPPYE